ncbi:MAG: hypothetical protein ACKV2T_43650 [Kofleriaceae bacterium]
MAAALPVASKTSAFDRDAAALPVASKASAFDRDAAAVRPVTGGPRARGKAVPA